MIDRILLVASVLVFRFAYVVIQRYWDEADNGECGRCRDRARAAIEITVGRIERWSI